MLNKIFLTIFCLLISGTLFASEKEIKLSSAHALYFKSDINSCKYKLFISLPKNYEQEKNTTYPVVYLLDPYLNFAFLHNFTQYLSVKNELPKMILVGIGYDYRDDIASESPTCRGGNEPFKCRINRSRDYTNSKIPFPHVDYDEEYRKYHGGGRIFTDVIKKEIMSKIKKNYRVNDFNVLIGHSYGGLFASHLFFAGDDAFNNYIAISPSYWYNDDEIFGKFNPAIIKNASKMYVAFGAEESPLMLSSFAKMRDLIASYNKMASSDNIMDIKFQLLEEETHSSVPLSASIRGLKHIFMKK
jgi:predicted alpha/beta superfamily hydrolase